MAPPRKHNTELILDAARGIVLVNGPRAASITAIANASGAPVGTLYHRFGTRDSLLAAVWLRARERFDQVALAGAAGHDDPLERGVALAAAAVQFAQRDWDDARLLLAVRRGDLLDGSDDETRRHQLSESNVPLVTELREIARALYGQADARSLARVTRAVVDLPASAVRRFVAVPALPAWLASDVAAEARLILRAS